jgi:hypothetical protein
VCVWGRDRKGGDEGEGEIAKLRRGKKEGKCANGPSRCKHSDKKCACLLAQKTCLIKKSRILKGGKTHMEYGKCTKSTYSYREKVKKTLWQRDVPCFPSSNTYLRHSQMT